MTYHNTNLGVPLLGQALDEGPDLSRLGSSLHLPHAGIHVSVANIVKNGVVEQHSILGNNSNTASHTINTAPAPPALPLPLVGLI
jgi:hypothetical protein